MALKCLEFISSPSPLPLPRVRSSSSSCLSYRNRLLFGFLTSSLAFLQSSAQSLSSSTSTKWSSYNTHMIDLPHPLLRTLPGVPEKGGHFQVDFYICLSLPHYLSAPPPAPLHPAPSGVLPCLNIKQFHLGVLLILLPLPGIISASLCPT